MAFTRLAFGTVQRGQWVKCFTTTGSASEYALRMLGVTLTRPVPSFVFVHGYSDVFNTLERLYVKQLSFGDRNSYAYLPDSGAEIWLYHEIKSPLPDPCPWEVWGYVGG